MQESPNKYSTSIKNTPQIPNSKMKKDNTIDQDSKPISAMSSIYNQYNLPPAIQHKKYQTPY